MNKSHEVKLLSTIVEKAVDGDDLVITGYASTGDLDRGGDTVLPDAWKKGGLDNFKTNPILLFNHKYEEPIGSVTDMAIDSKGLRITARVSQHAQKIFGLIKDGVLKTFSVGFRILDADYNKITDGFIIKSAELLEVSVVSIPMNQAAVFSLKKSLVNPDELELLKKEFTPGQTDGEINVSKGQLSPTQPTTEKVGMKESIMDPDDLQNQKVADAVAKALEAARAEDAKAVREKAAKEEQEKAALENATKAAEQVAAKIVATSEEKLLGAVSAEIAKQQLTLSEALEKFGAELQSKSEEFAAMRTSKQPFMKEKNLGEVFESDAAKDAYVLAKILKKGFGDTKFGQEIVEKVNAHSGVQVSSDKYEQEISTSIERDIQLELILAPMFREVRLNSASLVFPVMPDAGYAELVGAATAPASATETPPQGNLDARGATYGAPYGGIALSEVTLNTIKLSSVSYLGNETEEDAIMPILPLIRESMARSHARAIENMILAGNSATNGVYTANAHDGLVTLANTSVARNNSLAGPTTKVTAADLLALRRKMGKYGTRPSDVVYIVSQTAYFDLLEDPEFADANLVGSLAIKLTGEVGQVYGSPVVMCDEFKTPASGIYTAVALNRRNFIMPRLRNVTVESEYQTTLQRTALVATQRLGFKEIIPNATAVVGLKYT